MKFSLRLPYLELQKDQIFLFDTFDGRLLNFACLGGIDWISVFKEYPSDGSFNKVDQLAKEHIFSFWGMYDVPFNFDVEHKLSNTALKAATFGKAHYLLQTWDEESQSWSGRKTAIRGVVKDRSLEINPYYVFLNNILEGIDEIPEDLCYEQKSLLKITGYKKNQKSKSATNEKKALRPGDAFIQKRRFKAINNWLPLETADVYKKK